MGSGDRSAGFLAWAMYSWLVAGCYGSAAAIWSFFCVWGPNPATPPLSVLLGLGVGLSQAWAASEVLSRVDTRAHARLRTLGLACGCLPWVMPLLIAAAWVAVKHLVTLTRALLGHPPPTVTHFTIGTLCGPPPVASLFVMTGLIACLVQGLLGVPRFRIQGPLALATFVTHFGSALGTGLLVNSALNLLLQTINPSGRWIILLADSLQGALVGGSVGCVTGVSIALAVQALYEEEATET